MLLDDFYESPVIDAADVAIANDLIISELYPGPLAVAHHLSRSGRGRV
jgi:hypothetical protein